MSGRTVVRDIDLAGPLPCVPAVDTDGTPVTGAWLLVRLFTEPIGTVLVDVPDQGLGPAELTAVLNSELGTDLRHRLAAHGLVGLPVEGVTPHGEPAFLARRREVLATAPHITVVVCTRERPGSLARCLESLLAQDYPGYSILVVDNAPTTGATAEVVHAAARRGPVEYLVEPTPGLSYARNAAVAVAGHRILAWIDDDEVADPHWLAEIARALADHPDADVICGVIVPAELETDAQRWFEQYGGHSKGRGFHPAVFGPSLFGPSHPQSPLYPLPPFGTGANMTFRPGVIERIGGFDTALGAGTPAMGAEDTLAFTRVLLDGGTIVYRPTAVTHHYHRRDYDGLRRQMTGYGTGLTAAYTSLLLSDPRLVWPLLRLIPAALRDLRAPSLPRRGGFPRELLRANRRGMLAGPRAYLRGRRAARERHHPDPDAGRPEHPAETPQRRASDPGTTSAGTTLRRSSDLGGRLRRSSDTGGVSPGGRLRRASDMGGVAPGGGLGHSSEISD